MMPNSPNAADVTQLLDQEISALEAVMDVLDSEHDALESRNAEALTAASELKLKCIETARRIGAERAALLTDTNEISGNPQISIRWDRLTRLAHGCKEKNERNGMLIRWQHKYVEQTLAVLRQSEPGDTLYEASGENSRRSARHSDLGSA